VQGKYQRDDRHYDPRDLDSAFTSSTERRRYRERRARADVGYCGYDFLLDRLRASRTSGGIPYRIFGLRHFLPRSSSAAKRMPVDAAAQMLFDKAYVVTAADTPPPSE
jgi:hypothetical protein